MLWRLKKKKTLNVIPLQWNFDNIKTCKINNAARVVTSGSSAAVESLSIFVEKELYKLSENVPSQIKDINDGPKTTEFSGFSYQAI